MSTQSLAQLVEDALGGLSAPVFDTDVVGSQGLPWIVFVTGLPSPSERALGRSVHARTGRVLVKCAAATGHGARLLGDEVDAALEGAQFTPAGWRLGPLELVNVREPSADYEVTTTTSNHPVVQILEYVFTAIRG